jgi:hypothetical protein
MGLYGSDRFDLTFMSTKLSPLTNHNFLQTLVLQCPHSIKNIKHKDNITLKTANNDDDLKNPKMHISIL